MAAIPWAQDGVKYRGAGKLEYQPTNVALLYPQGDHMDPITTVIVTASSQLATLW
jgi:hypothetical protein